MRESPPRGAWRSSWENLYPAAIMWPVGVGFNIILWGDNQLWVCNLVWTWSRVVIALCLVKNYFFSANLACLADVFFPFSRRRDRESEWQTGASEWAKSAEKWRGAGGKKREARSKFRSLHVVLEMHWQATANLISTTPLLGICAVL